MQLVEKLYKQLMPHEHCFLDEQWAVPVFVLSNAFISLSYFVIALSLLRVLLKKSGETIRHFIGVYASFILLCGVCHALAAVNTYYGYYLAETLLLAITAIVSALATIPTFVLSYAISRMSDTTFQHLSERVIGDVVND